MAIHLCQKSYGTIKIYIKVIMHLESICMNALPVVKEAGMFVAENRRQIPLGEIEKKETAISLPVLIKIRTTPGERAFCNTPGSRILYRRKDS